MDLDSLLKRHKARSEKKKNTSLVVNDASAPPPAPEVAPSVEMSVAEETGVLVGSSSQVPASKEKRVRSPAPKASQSKKRKVCVAVGPSNADERGLFLEGEATLREFPIPGFNLIDLQGLAFQAKKRCLPEQGISLIVLLSG